MIKKGFGSDNHSGVHPEIMEAIARANLGHAPSYGTDETSLRALEILQKHFGPKAEAFFVFNGTAANVLCLQALVKSYQSVLCADVSHLYNDECGAPEKIAGCKLLPVPSVNGKVSVGALQEFLVRRGDQHYAQVKAVSITQPTEVGTVYSLEELRAISEFCKAHQLFLHMDGSRLPNAAVSLGASFSELVVGVDALSLGGTKNGLLFGEAVLFFKSELARDFKYIRKQSLQLPSKTRFVAAQFETYLGTDLWKKNASHVLRMAKLLEKELLDVSHVAITQPVQSNAVFAKLPRSVVGALRETYFFYIIDEKTFEARLMTSFDTTEEDVRGFTQLLKRLLEEKS